MFSLFFFNSFLVSRFGLFFFVFNGLFFVLLNCLIFLGFHFCSVLDLFLFLFGLCFLSKIVNTQKSKIIENFTIIIILLVWIMNSV